MSVKTSNQNSVLFQFQFRVNMSTPVVNTANLRNDNKIVDANDQKVPIRTVVHCLGALFKVTNSGIRHFVGKIKDNTYFVNQKYFH